MNAPAPPMPPTSVALEDGGPERLPLKLLSWSVLTVAATAWLCTFGPIPAVLSIAVAKHVLVAILVMGVGIDGRRVSADSADAP
jgi:hypothetical protein